MQGYKRELLLQVLSLALATGSLDDFVLGDFSIGRVEDFVETFDYLNLFEGGINPFFVLPAQEPCVQTTILD